CVGMRVMSRPSKTTEPVRACGLPQIVIISVDLPAHEIARLRIAQSPEGRRIFPRMTVLENLQMGAGLDNLKHFAEDV
ncbi:hypothetical protein AB9F46_36105, partial [Rhizobium leguminosarum]